MDLYEENEHSQGLRREAPLRTLVTDTVVQNWLGIVGNDIEVERIILGEEIWTTFASYRALLGRACLLTIGLRPFQGNQRPWYRDESCRSLLRSAVGEGQANAIDSISIGKLAEAHKAFAAKINDMLRKFPPS